MAWYNRENPGVQKVLTTSIHLRMIQVFRYFDRILMMDRRKNAVLYLYIKKVMKSKFTTKIIFGRCVYL